MASRTHVLADLPLRCLVSAPDTRAPLPLLVFLHGYDEAAPTPPGEALRRHGPLAPTSAARSDFIVLAPQLHEAGDRWRFHAADVVQAIERVESRWRVDADRRYLTGFSFGANGVFDLALEMPPMWAALWPVDPTRLPENDPGVPVWLSSGEISRLIEQPLRAKLGLQVKPEGLRVIVDYGLNHVETAARAYADEAAYRWLLRQRRETPRPSSRRTPLAVD
ncbi:MAG TPA: hypothetical protein VFB36_09780 [Nevskiaceae bacterium]|nr:hypothetical protein [Nevskiaceae bacterium]